MRTLFVIIGLTLAAGGYWYMQQAGPAAAPQRSVGAVTVTQWQVQPEQFQSRVNALGTLRAWESVDITSSVSETVVGLHFEDGQQVTTGTLLVTMQQEEEQRSEEHTSELQSHHDLVCRLLLETYV